MEFFSKMTKILIVAAMLVNTSLAFGETTSVPVQLQKMKLAELKVRFDQLKKDEEELVEFNDALGTAKQEEGAWIVTLHTGNQLQGWSKLFEVVAVVGRFGISFLKDQPNIYERARRPLNMTIIIAGVAIVSGVALSSGSAYELKIASGDRIKALKNISAVQQLMDTEKATIATLSQDLGAKVKNNIISFEGIPDALKVIGGSSLNLNTLAVGN